jgi:hypothetical protein
MQYTTTVRGEIMMGSGDQAVPIPVSAKFPPDQPGSFVFNYTADNPADTAHLALGAFADWVGKNIGPGVFDAGALPPSMLALEVALKTLHLETTGSNFAMTVLLGAKAADGIWRAEWKLSADQPVTLGDVMLDIKQV